MKLIPLSQGKYAKVDDEDYEALSKHNWSCSKRGNNFYAVRCIYPSGYEIQMHRELLKLKPEDPHVDHRDNDGLNNQKLNLRCCTISQNQMNRAAPRNNTSGIKGVSYNKRNRKWVAHIYAKGKHYYLGYFEDINEAAKAYNDAALVHHGEFAKLNGE